MCQIVTRKKKGKPSKPDLTRRNALPDYSLERDLRRSIRRRNVRYTFDYDDYIDDDEDYEEEEADEENERRRAKKLELLMKLQVKGRTRTESAPSQSRRVTHTPTPSTSSSDYGGDSKPLKKRKIDSDEDEDIYQVQGRKSEPKRAYSVPGTQGNSSSFPLPHNKTLELILDKLQKKDIYGVFAEPVDPEELPDYHDVIKHPMDFATVRRRLATGKYRTFSQFQNDVFLICKNAMKYNASDTVYHKQAFSIQELAKRKFELVKCEIRDSEKELKSEPKPILISLPPKQIKKPINSIVHEPAGFDFTSGPTLPPAVDRHNIPSATRVFESVKPAVDGFLESSAPILDANSKKDEDEQEGKGILPGFGKKPSVQDENRRETYQLLNQTAASSESIFEGEIKQLVPVGLEAEYSYARSLARFAATLGSAAWQVAARRIEQALPPETKFGRGWVGEYEPLPTPVLMLENQSVRESSYFTRSPCMNDGFKDDKVLNTSLSRSEHPVTGHQFGGKSMMFGEIRNEFTKKVPSKVEHTKTALTERNLFLFGQPKTKSAGSVNFNSQQQIHPARVFTETDKRFLNIEKPNGTPFRSQTDFAAYGSRYQQQNQPAKIFVETDKKALNRVEQNAAPSSVPGLLDFASQRVEYQPQQQSQRASTDRRVVNSVELNGAPSHNQSQIDFGAHSGFRYQHQNQPTRIFANPLELNGAPSPNRSQESFSSHSVNYQHQPSPNPMAVESRKVVKNQLEVNGAPSPKHYRSDFADHGVSYQQLNQSGMGFAKNGEKLKNTFELNKPPSPDPTRPNFGVHRQVLNHFGLQDAKPKESISMDRNLLRRQYIESAIEIQPAVHPVPSVKREDTGNAATTAARAWMSIGAAGGFRQDNHIQADLSHNHLIQDHQQQISRFQGEFPINGILFHSNMNRFPPVNGFVAPSHVRMSSETDFRNQQHPHNYHQMVFPQLVNRFQGGESIQTQARQKQESMLPPDLNIGFQSSPVRQSSSIDSQHPELALQL